MKKNSLTRRMFLNCLFAAILIVLLASNIFSYHQIAKVINANEWVKHTHQVINHTNNILINLVKIESATRGYLFSKNPSFVDDVNEEISSVFDNFKIVKELTNNNLRQQARLEKLEPILNDRINDLKKQIALQDKNEVDLIAILPLINQSKKLTVKIQETINEIYEDEVKLLQEREDTFIWNFDITNIVSNTIDIVNIVFLSIIMILLNKMLSNLITSENQLKQSEFIIKCIIGNSKEYIGAIDLNYNFLAFSDSFEKEFREMFGKHISLGDNLKDLLAHVPEVRKKALALWGRALSGEEFTLIEGFGSDLKSERQYELTYSSIYNEKNKLIGAAVIARNVGKRLEEESNLRKINEELGTSLHQAEIKAREMNIINSMYNKLQSSNTMGETLQVVALYFQKLLPTTAGVVYLMNNSRNYLENAIEWNEPKFIESIITPEQCWGLREGKIFLYVNENESVSCKHSINLRRKFCPYICVPLLALNEIIGVIHLQLTFLTNVKKSEIVKFYECNNLMIQNVISQIALSISNVKLHEVLKVRSIHDPLTGLYNRSYLDDFLERDIQRAKRKNFCLAIVMMDLDHFKNVNDLYGHEAGNVVLKKISNLISMKLRKSDIACRYGGEEIVIILYDILFQDVLEKVNELRLSISTLEFQFVDLVKVTASFGIAMFPEDGQDSQQLIKAADEALYYSKKAGRNKVTFYHSMNKPSNKK